MRTHATSMWSQIARSALNSILLPLELRRRTNSVDIFAGTKRRGRKTKNIRALHTAFLRLTNTGSWEEAVQLYPQFTTDDQIKRFLYCDLKKSKSVPKSFSDFCQ